MLSSFRNRIAFLLAFSGVVLAQAPAPVPVRGTLDFKTIPRPPVPADALELAAGAAQPVQDVQQRVAAISLLNKSRDLANVRARPYHLKTFFSSSGGLASDGTWTLEDTASAAHSSPRAVAESSTRRSALSRPGRPWTTQLLLYIVSCLMYRRKWFSRI